MPDTKKANNAYICINAEPEPNISDPTFNKHYLTAKEPRNRTASCSFISELEKNITQNEILKSIDPKLNKNTSMSSSKEKVEKNSDIKKQAPQGMLRYININKRKMSPQKEPGTEKKQKNCDLDPLKNNRFALLSNDNLNDESRPPEKVAAKPPPIFLRETGTSEIVKIFTDLIGKNTFHIVPIRRGEVLETKIIVYAEEKYREILRYLTEKNKNFYTYQLKSSKGLKVIFKGIDSCVDPSEIKDALEELGYNIKSVINIFNKQKIPQPMFRVELEPDNRKFKKNETHPIYSIKYLIHRRITVEEPHKRNGPVQCMNCQEFGHTKSYCKLRAVCVACGDFHPSSQCSAAKEGQDRKCGNCGGNHSANYRGCPVYKELLKRLKSKNQAPKTNPPVINNIQNNVASKKVDSSQSFANILKSGVDNGQASSGSQDSYINALNQSIISLNQNMTSFLSTMQNTMQDLMRTQNQMLQILLSNNK